MKPEEGVLMRKIAVHMARPERQRRLLYNAVTRAKRQALVVVQNPDRLKSPPFATESLG